MHSMFANPVGYLPLCCTRQGTERAPYYQCRRSDRHMARHVEGPFFRTGKNTWYVTHRSRKVSLGVTGRANRVDAIDAWHRLLLEDRPEPKPGAKSLSDAASEFLTDVRSRLKPSTHALYGQHLTKLVAGLGRLRLTDLTDRRLADWLRSLKVSDTTQKIALSSVGSWLGWCVRQGYIDRNPVERMNKPKGRSRGRETVIRPEDHARLMEVARPELRDVLTLLYLTGARPSEVCAITAENFDPDAGVVRLTEHKTDRTGRDRIVQVPPEGVALLNRLVAKWGTGPLLRHSLGGRWTSPAVGWQVRALCKRIGIKVIPYGYRHTLATDALAAGVPDAHVAHLLGHRSTQMLMLHYAHLGERSRVLKESLGRIR